MLNAFYIRRFCFSVGGVSFPSMLDVHGSKEVSTYAVRSAQGKAPQEFSKVVFHRHILYEGPALAAEAAIVVMIGLMFLF